MNDELEIRSDDTQKTLKPRNSESQTLRQSDYLSILSFLKITFLFVYLFICLFAIVPSTKAQEFSTSVNPTILEIKADPPAQVQAPIVLENNSDQPTTYSFYLRPFKASSDLNGEPNYDPELMPEYAEFFKTVKLYEADSAVTEIKLAPKEKKKLSLKISVPEGSTLKDYYFTVVFLSQTEPKEITSNEVMLRGGIGTNVLLSVASNQQSEGRVANYFVPRFINEGPVDFSLEIANHSDSYISSRGNIIIKNMLGQPVANLEIIPTNVLANSNRLVELSWDNKYPLGIYKADLSLALSEKGLMLKESKYFIALPLKVMLVTIAIISFGVWLIVAVRNRAQED